MEVEEKRTVVASADAPDAIKEEVRRAGGTVLQRPQLDPRNPRPTVPAITHPAAAAEVPPSPSTSPVEGALAGESARGKGAPVHPEDCRHDKDGSTLLPVSILSATPLYASYCVRCGSLGPTKGRAPTLGRWMIPG